MKLDFLNVRLLALVASAAVTLQPCETFAQDLPEASRLTSIPAGAKELAEAIKGTKVGDAITVRGRVSTEADAFAEGKGEFAMIDDAAAASIAKPNDGQVLAPAKRPRTDRRATVRLVDRQGKALGYSLKDRSGLVANAEVFVVGKVAALGTETSPILIEASGVHVPRASMPAGFMMGEAPASALDVAEAKKGIKMGDRIVVKGRIGGSKQPFVKERAVFTIVGRQLKACNEIPGDSCKFPWDYCCDTREEILANSATVQVVDAKGAPLRTDMKGRWDLRELSEVIVTGTVQEIRGAALIVNAEHMHIVRP